MPSPELATLIASMRTQPRALDITIAELRTGFDMMGGMSPMPDGVRCEAVDAEGVSAEWITPAAVDERTILYLHGGGYVIGSIGSHRALVARIAIVARARALLIDYRLAPEHAYPAAVDDATAAYRWLLAQGVAPARLAIAGDSAGGGLTAATLVALRDAGDPLPAAAVCISPWLDLACSGESMRTKAADDPILSKERLSGWARHYLNGTDARTPIASPLYGDLSGLPPLLVQVGTAEVLLDDSLRYAARARAAGVDVTLEPWEEMIHIWPIFFMLPEAQQAIDRVGAWLCQRIASG